MNDVFISIMFIFLRNNFYRIIISKILTVLTFFTIERPPYRILNVYLMYKLCDSRVQNACWLRKSCVCPPNVKTVLANALRFRVNTGLCVRRSNWMYRWYIIHCIYKYMKRREPSGAFYVWWARIPADGYRKINFTLRGRIYTGLSVRQCSKCGYETFGWCGKKMKSNTENKRCKLWRIP